MEPHQICAFLGRIPRTAKLAHTLRASLFSILDADTHPGASWQELSNQRTDTLAMSRPLASRSFTSIVSGKPTTFYFMSVVQQAIQNGVCQGRITNDFVPMHDGQLTRDKRGATAMTILHDFQQIGSLCQCRRFQPPIINDQEIGFGQLCS